MQVLFVHMGNSVNSVQHTSGLWGRFRFRRNDQKLTAVKNAYMECMCSHSSADKRCLRTVVETPEAVLWKQFKLW